MNLTDRIAKIPRPRLAELIGEDLVEALDELAIGRTSRELAQALQDLHGSALFKVKGLLRALVVQFSAAESRQLAGDPNSWIDHKWSANSRTKQLAQILGVEIEDYLPQGIAADQIDYERVVPNIDIQKMCADPELASYCMFPLHGFQKRVKDAFIDALLQRDARFLVHMPTGSGKTKTAIEGLVDFWRVRGRDTGFIVWLVHRRELCVQAYETFSAIWRARGDYPLTIVKAYDKHSPDFQDIGSGVAFVGFQKLHSWIQRNHPSAIFIRDNTRVVVVDEAHMALAPTYARCIEYLVDNTPARLVGLTATPGRGGDVLENERFVKYFSGNIFGVEIDRSKYQSAIEFLQAGRFLARLKRVPLESEVQLTAADIAEIDMNSLDLPKRILTRLSLDASRNLMILSEIKKAVIDRNDPTLVFATSVQHAVLLQFLLQKEDIEARCVLDTTPSVERARSIKEFCDNKLPVLINYDILTTGFDAPNLGTLVIARPTTSIILYSQMLGRALRGPKMGGNTEENTLVDLVDNKGRFGDEHAAFTYFYGYFEEP